MILLNAKKNDARDWQGKGDQLVISWKFPCRKVRGENRREGSIEGRRTRGGVTERNRWRKARRRESVLAGRRSPGSPTRRRGERSANARRRYRPHESTRCRSSVSRQDSKVAVKPIDHRSEPSTCLSLVTLSHEEYSPGYRWFADALFVEPGCLSVWAKYYLSTPLVNGYPDAAGRCIYSPTFLNYTVVRSELYVKRFRRNSTRNFWADYR